jgi:hypothetical membrane protein
MPLAFPNAYLEVDEPPSQAFRDKIVSLLAIVGIAYFGLTILVLHFEPTGYDPVRQVVSDYAVGPFAFEMELGFFAGGIGLVALAIAIAITDAPRTFKFGVSALFIAGVSLVLVGVFPTDIEEAGTTLHGEIHLILALVVFGLTSIGILLVSYGRGRRWFLTTLSFLVISGVFVAVDAGLALNASGLAERFFILVLLAWQLRVSFDLFRNS